MREGVIRVREPGSPMVMILSPVRINSKVTQ